MPEEFQSSVRTYKYPFELVMKAYERRFPTCPEFMPIVLETVIIEEETEGPRRHTKRRCKLRVDAPYIFKKIIGIESAYFIQDNFLDLKERKLTIEATNETFSSRIKIFEKCRYYVHPENDMWTCFDQSANIEITNFFGFEHQMEKVGMKQYTQMTLKGKEIIEHFVNQLRDDGITHIDRWCDPEGTAESESQKKDESPLDATSEGTKEQKRLNADYIKNFLGELTPHQESRLLQMRKKLEDQNFEKIPDYPTLLRFLRARDFSLEKSTTMLIESMKWRKEHDVDNLLKVYHEPHVVVKYFPGEWISNMTDNEQRPLYVIKLGNMDVKGLLKSIGEEGLVKLTLYICEQGLKRMEELTNKHGKPIWQWCLLVDCMNLSMRHLWRPGLATFLRIIETVEKNYPETMGRVLIVRAPRVFPILWTIVSAFIDENTRNKFLFFEDTAHGLNHFIPQMPNDFLTTSDKTLIHNGGIVPKQLYKTDSIEEPDQGNSVDWESDGDDLTQTKIKLNEHNIYQSVKLQPGQYYEIVIKNDDNRAVLTWDYESTKTEILFTIYQTDGTINDLSTDDDFSSLFDVSGLKENVNYKKKEQTITSRSKESIQGSIEMEKATYILQWMTPLTAENSTRLMYFYEILSSATYRGSMTSLQSASLSAISLHSTR